MSSDKIKLVQVPSTTHDHDAVLVDFTEGEWEVESPDGRLFTFSRRKEETA